MEHKSDESIEEFWTHKWESSSTPWLTTKVNQSLMKYFQKCFPYQPPKRAFVPLCGKTLDMLWLAERGCEVVGVELYRGACEDFFKEQSLPYEMFSFREGIHVFKCTTLSITIYNCNIFDLTESDLGKFGFIWDRGSFVAVANSVRPKYYAMIKSLYDQPFHHLIEAVVYNQAEYQGYPRCLTLSHLNELIADDNIIVEVLEEADRLEFAEVAFLNKFTYFNVIAYLLSRK